MKKSSKENNLIYIILIVFVAFVFIIISEIFIVDKIIKAKRDSKNESSFMYKTNDKYYDTSNIEPIDINLDDKFTIGTSCENNCNYKYQNYYFIFNKDSNYILTIVDGNRLVKELSIGTTLENVSIFKYKDYIAVSNIKTVNSFNSDYVLLINSKNQIDEYTSLESNEIEYTEDGIMYYYSECFDGETNNAYRIKVLRKPFETNKKEIFKEEKSYPWCIK